MTLDILIQEIMSDNKSRTALELYNEIISSKKYFFEVLKPESAVKRTCNNLYKKEILTREKKNNRWYYTIPYVSEELDRDIKETINSEKVVIQQDIDEDIKNIVEEVIVEVENKKVPEKMMTMNSVLLFAMLASGIYLGFK
jgi:predicted transcriptional regulator